MKLYVHIDTRDETLVPNPCVVIECDGIPRRGDVFYLDRDRTLDLEKQLKGSVEFDIWDCFYVSDVIWEDDEQGIYRCHISLTDPFYYEERYGEERK